MSKLMKLFNTFVTDDSGQGIAEYAAMLGFVAILIVLVYGFWKGTLMNTINGLFTYINAQLSTITSGG